jgi:hypothetical protein
VITDEALVEQLKEYEEKYPILKYFRFDHLPKDLRVVSKRFAVLAADMAFLSHHPEIEAGLRKLLEAKDCAVRAALP